MSAKSGLYYPYIHFRDDQWLKLAALYWTSMARMVPHNYPTSDSPTVERLKGDLDFVVDLQPGASAERTARLFLSLLESHGETLVERLGVGYPERDARGWRWKHPEGKEGRIGFIYAEKLNGELISAMSSLGLAMPRPGAAHKVDRISMMHGEAPWIGMDERLAAVYMSVLADDVATSNAVAPCTDQPGLVAAIGGWSMETVAQLLLGEPSDTEPALVSDVNARELIAYMAIDMIGPTQIERVPVEKIVQFRLKHGDELSAFRRTVEEIVEELPNIGPDMSVAILNTYIKEEVTVKLDNPRRELQRALKASKIDTALKMIGIQVTLPGLSAGLGSIGVGLDPLIGTGVGAAVGFATAARERSKFKANLRTQASAASYLLELERSLTSPSFVQRRVRSAAVR